MKIACILILAMLSLHAPAGDLLFSQMEDGDRVEITYQSIGCFHQFTKYFEVKRVDGEYTVTEYQITWSEDKPKTIIDQRPIAEMPLSRRDIRRLDGLLRYYRGPRSGDSTTEETVRLEYFEPHGRIDKERFRDRSGGPSDRLSFYALKRRLAEHAQPQAADHAGRGD